MNERVVIVGVGALGSHLALLARNWPVELVLVDFDRVEQKNLLSQFHTRMGLGRNKAQALQQTLQGLFAVRARAVPHKLTADNAEQLLTGAHLVIDCVDNAQARALMQRVVRAGDIPCLHGALAADGAYARVMWDAQFTIDEGGEGEATCEDGQHLPFIAIVAGFMAQAAQRFLSEGEQRSLHLHPEGVMVI